MKYLMIISILLSSLSFTTFQTSKKTITGQVVDVQQHPIAFANIQIKDVKTSVSSDAQGNFSIAAKIGDVLVISSVGYKTKHVKVQQSHLKITLENSEAILNEVVVIGYGTKQKRDVLNYASTPVGHRNQASPSYHYNPMPTNTDRYNNTFNREGYDHITENTFLSATENPLSTFSIDVDAASYANVRRFLQEGSLPPAGAVRVEEMINYFSYNYPQPKHDEPFSINTEYTVCPWNTSHHLVSIGLQGKKIATENLPPSNLVFLIDVSGSMDAPNKLPLVKSSMKLLVSELRPQDKVAIVVYAGNAGLVLPSTSGRDKYIINEAIERLHAGGSTAGGAGISLAYQTAKEHFIKNGNNRVILCTDGDFNVGTSSDDELISLIEAKRVSGIFLSVLGFGTGNYQDAKMQKLANKGNGNHAYIDDILEAKKVLVTQFGGTLFTIAKDVKLQIEFNPELVQGYRLIGYENRLLAKEDFNDDKKDAGELGSGHTVTALYEIIPVGVTANELKKVDDLKYQQPAKSSSNKNEVLTIKFRYKSPDSEESKLLTHILSGTPTKFSATTDNLKLAATVAQFGMLLSNSAYKGTATYQQLHSAVKELHADNDYTNELAHLILRAKEISRQEKNDTDKDLTLKN